MTSSAGQVVPSGRPFLVALEGNIGSGKSTVLQHLSRLPGVQALQEPLHKWCDVGGANLLQLLYQDPSRWSFLFQSYVQLTRLQMQRGYGQQCRVRIMERSLQSTRHCFIDMSRWLGSLNDAEVSVLSRWHEHAADRVDLAVYLRTSPDTALRRLRARARDEEAGVTADYLRHLHDWHERWLMTAAPAAPAALLVIDADQPLQEVLAQCDRHEPVILGQCAPPPPPPLV